nr:MAG TPA: hypothetical protein [Caudoviricetes sp.]
MLLCSYYTIFFVKCNIFLSKNKKNYVLRIDFLKNMDYTYYVIRNKNLKKKKR